MTVKAAVEWARAIPGGLGVAVYAGDVRLFSDGVGAEHAAAIRDMLRLSPGAVRASVVVRGVTFVAFYEAGLTIVVAVAGRFPTLPELRPAEPEFARLPGEPAFPSREMAAREAEAVLRQYGFL